MFHKSVLNTLPYMYVCIMVFPELLIIAIVVIINLHYQTKIVYAGVYAKCMTLKETFQLYFKLVCIFSPRLVMVMVLNFSHSNRYGVISHCGLICNSN